MLQWGGMVVWSSLAFSFLAPTNTLARFGNIITCLHFISRFIIIYIIILYLSWMLFIFMTRSWSLVSFPTIILPSHFGNKQHDQGFFHLIVLDILYFSCYYSTWSFEGAGPKNSRNSYFYFFLNWHFLSCIWFSGSEV